MPKRPDDLTPNDPFIFEHIAREGVGRAKTIGDDVGLTRQHTSRRLRDLSRNGYVRDYADGTYLLTEKGEEMVATLIERGFIDG